MPQRISIIECSWCKQKVKDSKKAAWRDKTESDQNVIDGNPDDVSHGICPDCNTSVWGTFKKGRKD